MSSVLSYINDLGAFDSMKAVWERYPEGGREGDYVTVGGLRYGWNKYDLVWEYDHGKVTESAARSATAFDGDVFVQNNLTVAGTLRAKHIPNPNCGLFKDLETLEAVHPEPETGMWAVVGDSIPGYIYRCESEGVWSATGEIGGGDSLDSDYVMRRLDETAERLEALNEAVSRSVGNDELGTRFTDGIESQKRVIDGTDAGLWRVMYQGRCIGVLEVFGDSARHCITQVLTTNATPDGEGGIADAHSHVVKQYGRMYNISYAAGVTADGELWPVGSWSSWKEFAGGSSGGSSDGSSGSGSGGSVVSGGADQGTVDALEASFCSLVLCLLQHEPVVFGGFAAEGATVTFGSTDLTGVMEGTGCPVYYVKGSGLGTGYFCYLRGGVYYATWTGSQYDEADYRGSVLAYRQSDEKLFLFKTGVGDEVYTVPFGLTLDEARSIASGGGGGALKLAQDAMAQAQANLETTHVNLSNVVALVRCLLKNEIVHFGGVVSGEIEVNGEQLVAEDEGEGTCPVYYHSADGGGSQGQFLYRKDGVYYSNWVSELHPMGRYQGELLCHLYGTDDLYLFARIGVHYYHKVNAMKYTEASRIMAVTGSGSGSGGSDSGTDYSGQIDALEETVSGHTATLSLIQTKNNEQDAAISSLSGSVGNQATSIGQITTKNTEQDGRLSTLESDLATLRNTVEAGGGSGGGTDYGGQIDALEETVSGHTSTLALMQTKNNDQDAAISSLSGSVGNQAASIGQINSKNSEQDGRLSTLESDLATLRNTVEAGGGSGGSGSSGGTTDAAQLNAELTVLEQCLLGGALVEFAGFAPEGTVLTNGSTILSSASSCPIYFVQGTTALNGGFGCLDGGDYWSNWILSGAWAKSNYPSSGTVIGYETGTSTVYLFKSALSGWVYTQIGATDKATFEAIRDRYLLVGEIGNNKQGVDELRQSVTSLQNEDTEINRQLADLFSSRDGHDTDIANINAKNTDQDNRLTQLETDVAALQAGGSGSSGSTDGVDAAQLAAEMKVLEQCLLGGNVVEIAGIVSGSLTDSSPTSDTTPTSCPIYFVQGSSASVSGFGYRPPLELKYYSLWTLTGDWARSNYYPSSGYVIAYNLNDSKVYLFTPDLASSATGYAVHEIGATDRETFDAIKARYTAVESLRTTADGHETRIATLETDVAALQAGSGGSGSGSAGTAEVLTVDAAALDSLCPDTTAAKSLFQHAEKMRYVVTVTSGGVTVCVGELVMYADAGGRQITQELRSHYFITGNTISSTSVRLDAMNTFVRTFGILSTNNTYSTEGAWTYWRPKDGVLQLGESDVNTNSYMQDNVPSALKIPLICGNKYITRILFTVTKDSVTHSGIVDQQVSGTTCMQRLHMDSRIFTRYIYFTNATRTIVSGSPQTWQYSEARNLDYNKTTGLLKMTNMWGNNVGSSVKIPESDDSFPGLVPKGTLSKVSTLMAAQQRTWAVNEPALQFDFYEKHPKDVAGTMPVLRGYGTSFRMCNYDVTYAANGSPTFTDINANVFFHFPMACPSSFTYGGVTYTSVSRHFALFRKFKRRGNRRYKEEVGNFYPAKKKQGYIEYLGRRYPSSYYNDRESLVGSGEFLLRDYMAEFPNIFVSVSGEHHALSNGSRIVFDRLGSNQEFHRFVSTIKVGICLVLECRKSGQKPLFVYGPMMRGRFVVIHITGSANPTPDIANLWFKRD